MEKPERRNKRRERTVNWQTVCELAWVLPEAEECRSYGTPAFKVRGKLFVRMHQDGESIVVRIDESDRAMRIQADRKAFYITDHYVRYPWMLVRLSAVDRDDLADLLVDAWRLRAPKTLVAEFEAADG